MKKSLKKLGRVVLFLLLSVFNGNAQYNPLYTHYFQNPLTINSAYTGFRNALSIDVSARRQWMGLQGAPQSVYLSGHSPINDTRISVGGFVQNYQSGPLSYNHFSFDYSYLARLGDRMFLSLGLNFGVFNHQLSLSKLVLIDGNDPYLDGTTSSSLMPFAGSGALLFTPHFYVGVSKPTIVLAQINTGGYELEAVKPDDVFYAMGGVSLPAYKHFKTTLTMLARIANGHPFVFDNSLQIVYHDLVGIGFGYRPGYTGAALLTFQLNKNFGLAYSYDFPVSGSKNMNYSSHEVTLTYDYYKWMKKNKYRAFKKKKQIVEDGSDFRSIRYF